MQGLQFEQSLKATGPIVAHMHDMLYADLICWMKIHFIMLDMTEDYAKSGH